MYDYGHYYDTGVSRIFLKVILKWRIIMKNLKCFMKEEEGMGTVEIVLIIVVLIALVAIFKDSIKKVVETILKKITTNANKI